MGEKGRKGLFLSFEGADGAGKTTQAALLKQRLDNLGFKVVLTREPGGTPIGEAIRSILLNPDFKEMSISCEALLYSAARAQLVAQRIKPYLEEGLIVICDRYLDSSLVYQGFAGGEDPEIIEKINLWATKELLPDLTFLLDIETEEGFSRLKKGGKNAPSSWPMDRIEQKPPDFHLRVRQGYLQLAADNPHRFFIIQAADRPEAVHEKVWAKTLELLRNWEGER